MEIIFVAIAVIVSIGLAAFILIDVKNDRDTLKAIKEEQVKNVKKANAAKSDPAKLKRVRAKYTRK